MSWARRIKWYIDVEAAGGKAPLLEGSASASLSSVPSLIAGDTFDLQLWFRSRAASPLSASTAAELTTGDSIVVSGKPTSGMADADPLFTAEAFEKATDGDDIYYQASCNLNTAEVQAAMAALSSNSLPITIDIEVEGENNEDRLSFQFAASLKRQAYDGAGAPAPIPGPSGLARWSDGSLQLKNVTTGLWHTLYLEGALGAGELKFGEGEE
jgi:hypothetical protein